MSVLTDVRCKIDERTELSCFFASLHRDASDLWIPCMEMTCLLFFHNRVVLSRARVIEHLEQHNAIMCSLKMISNRSMQTIWLMGVTPSLRGHAIGWFKVWLYLLVHESSWINPRLCGNDIRTNTRQVSHRWVWLTTRLTKVFNTQNLLWE